ncbi:MAG TPA: SCO family protein [Desulfuromonadaceae bacterium]|jgi:protein SCO1/2
MKNLFRSALMGRHRLFVMLSCFLMLASFPVALLGHDPQDAQQTGIGLEEQLGKRIPLDIFFRDETGQQVRLGDLINRPTIILPVYYSCTNVCNYLQGGLARILPTIKNSPGSEYRVISISFDETETPALAARYKKMYLASMNAPFPEDGWHFLTGDSNSIRRLTDAAGYHFQRKGRDYVHPVVSLVVSGDGTIVRYLYGTTFLSKDVTLALAEARSGVVGASIRKVVDYCFSFDPANKTYVFNLLRVSATVIILVCGAFLAFLIFGGKRNRRSSHTKAQSSPRDSP